MIEKRGSRENSRKASLESRGREYYFTRASCHQDEVYNYIAAKFIVNRTTVCLSCILSISFVRDKPVRIPARGNFSIKTSKFAA